MHTTMWGDSEEYMCCGRFEKTEASFSVGKESDLLFLMR